MCQFPFILIINNCTGSLRMWMGEENSLAVWIKYKRPKRYKNFENSEEYTIGTENHDNRKCKNRELKPKLQNKQEIRGNHGSYLEK